MFGSSSRGPNPASGQPAAGGIFGQQQQPAPAAASPFGSGSTAFGAAATPNPFGSTSTPNLQNPQQGTNNIFGAAPSSFVQQNAFALQQPTQNVVSVPSTPVTNPFGTLPAMPQITIGHSAGSGPSVQYVFSSLPVSEKPTQVRVNTLLTPRHSTQRSKVRMHARRYHPKKDSPKVTISNTAMCAGSNIISDAASVSFGQQNAFGLQQPTQNVVLVPPTLVSSPFGTLPSMPQTTIGRSAGSGPSVQHGISSMRVTSFSDGDDTLAIPEADVMSIPSSSSDQCPASSCSHPSYSYKPLLDGQIRLIELEAPRESEPLRGKIRHFPLSAELHYWALSYCWGSLKGKRTIILDGMKLQITVNLHDALRQLGNSYGMLWVDAICINQEDIPEKSREVVRMGEIYSGAHGVAAWLGVGDESSDKAMDFLKVLATKDPRAEYDEYFKALPSSGNHGKFGNEWIALKDLVKNGYWSRTWIIQELALCRRSKVVHCGTKSLPWVNFVNVFGGRFCTCVQHVTTREEVFGEGSSGLENLMTLSVFERCLVSGGIYVKGVFHLLSITERFQATDPRDKVYGILALSEDLRKLVRDPNYASSKGVVFRDLTKAMLADGYNLDLICYKHPTHVNQFSDVSWVPHWDVRGQWIESPEFLLHALENNPGGRVYSADDGRDANIKYVGDGSILRVRGYFYDTVDGLGSTGLPGWNPSNKDASEPDHKQNAYGSAMDTCRALNQLCQETFRVLNPQAAEHGYSLNNEFLICRLFLQMHSKASDFSRNVIDLPWLLHWLLQFAEFRFVGRSLYEWSVLAFYLHNCNTRGKALPSPSRDPDLDGMLKCLIKVARDGWRWLSTKRGYLGRTHPQTRKGDHIVIVQGCSVPMVLRLCGTHYSVVGAAYVQGIMHGEALQGVRDDQMRKIYLA